MIAVYVDDIAAAGPPSELAQLWSEVENKYDVGKLGECDEFLGIQVRRETGKDGRPEIRFGQEDYVSDIISEYRKLFPLERIIPRSTPLSDELRSINRDPVTPEPRVLKIVGRVLWLARCTRPDVSPRLGGGVGSAEEPC